MIKYKLNHCIEYLEIDPQYITEGIEYAKKEKLNSIRIRTLNRNAGEKYDIDFSVFENMSFVNKLIIGDDFKTNKIIAFEKIYTLKRLQHLEITQPIDLDASRLTSLKSLYIKDDSRIKNIDALNNLEELLITSSKHDNCLHLKNLKRLTKFRISGSMKTLEGIEGMENLQELKVSYSNKLTNIDAISSLTKLRKLHIEKCKLISNLLVLKDNSNIEELFIDNVDTLDFIPTMSNLYAINFWASKDGNLTPLLQSETLTRINFHPNKKHYTHTIEEIIELTGANRGRNR
ncbi:hypothetical protein [Bacteroides pyogenes]|uniref:hypothetical protein n=1 Tax=Bacteroides pyogenes TaxID=310300 RepID=UPI002A7F3F05|nr:hypothetical protein [Bacteroides pyogenes]